MVSDRVTELTHKLSDCSVVIKLSTGSAQKFENTIAKLNSKIKVSLSFFLSFVVWPLLPTHCKCRGLLSHLITLNDTQTHSVGLLWTNDQTDAETSTWQHTILTRDRRACPRRDFEPAIPGSERPQTYALDDATTGIGYFCKYIAVKIFF